MQLTYFAFFVLSEKAWFWIETFLPCQVLNWKRTTCRILNYKKQRVIIWNQKNSRRQILRWNFYKVSDLRLTCWTGVRFWIENFTTCQLLSVLNLQFANFSFVHQNLARYANVIMYGVDAVIKVTLLGYVLCLSAAINVKRHFRTAKRIECVRPYT